MSFCWNSDYHDTVLRGQCRFDFCGAKTFSFVKKNVLLYLINNEDTMTMAVLVAVMIHLISLKHKGRAGLVDG